MGFKKKSVDVDTKRIAKLVTGKFTIQISKTR